MLRGSRVKPRTLVGVVPFDKRDYFLVAQVLAALGRRCEYSVVDLDHTRERFETDIIQELSLKTNCSTKIIQLRLANGGALH